MRLLRPTAAALATALTAACAPTRPATTPPPAQPGAPAAQPGAQPGGAAAPNARRAPRPYAQVVTRAAVTDTGGITVHRVEDRWLFEVPDSLVGRDFLLVSRVAGVPTGFDCFMSAGTSVEER